MSLFNVGLISIYRLWLDFVTHLKSGSIDWSCIMILFVQSSCNWRKKWGAEFTAHHTKRRHRKLDADCFKIDAWIKVWGHVGAVIICLLYFYEHINLWFHIKSLIETQITPSKFYPNFTSSLPYYIKLITYFYFIGFWHLFCSNPDDFSSCIMIQPKKILR